jgi:photosystem II stability/assembly factor-like uncharacterized protein
LQLPPAANGEVAKKADLNLFHLFPDAKGRLFAAGERGMLLRSDDQGQHWTYLPTGYKGSFWTGIAPVPNVLLVAGLRGSIYRSEDDGESWVRVATPNKSSITALLAVGGDLLALGGDGLLLRSHDQGRNFVDTSRKDRSSLTASLSGQDENMVLFSRQGLVKD